MPIFSKNGSHILFIHIPKSAGSSVEKIGRDLGWAESFSERGKSLADLSYYKATPQHLHADLLEKIFNFDVFESIFTIVRNPFQRLKSEYYWQISQGITTLDVKSWVDDTFEKYQKNNFIYDNHIRPQVDFLPRSDNIKVFKLEENGIDQAKGQFVKYSKQQEKSGFFHKRFLKNSKFVAREKRSIPSRETDLRFECEYKKICEFYNEDFSKLLYCP